MKGTWFEIGLTTAILLVATTAFAQPAHDLTKTMDEQQAHQLGYRDFAEFTRNTKAENQAKIESKFGYNVLRASQPSMEIYSTQDGTMPMYAGRLHGTSVVDCNSTQGCWASSETFGGTFFNQNSITYEALANSAMHGITLSNWNPGHSGVYEPSYIVDIPPSHVGYCFGGVNAQYYPYCDLIGTDTQFQDGFSFSTSPVGHANMGNISWGEFVPTFNPAVSPFPQGMQLTWGGVNHQNLFDQSVINVGINPVPVSVTVPQGTYLVISTPHGAVIGQTTTNAVSSVTVTANTGVPPLTGGWDFHQSQVTFKAWSDAGRTDRFWWMNAFLSPGDVGSPVYWPKFTASGTSCMAPLGRILASNAYDSFTEPLGNSAIIEAWRPNIIYPYYNQSGGSNLQTIGSCIVAY